MITDPQAIKFCNETIRPTAESLRALVAVLAAIQTEWFAGINNLFPNDDTPVDDQREKEGVSRLTGEDINSFMNILISMASEKNDQIISKPCVRPFTAA